MSESVEQRTKQEIELAIQREIRQSEDDLVRWIEEALEQSNYCKFTGNPNDKKLEESQFRNVVRVADTTESPEVIKNFLRYQTGRDDKWGRGKGSLAERIIQDVDVKLKEMAQGISKRTDKAHFKEIWLDLIRRYLGYGSRYLLYLNTPKEN
jgi:hypothetical protein